MVQLNLTTFLNSYSRKPNNYLLKQFNDIKLFGSARKFPNISDDILDKYTPYRRLSNKPSELSDNKYFIDKFEKDATNELPKMWNKMTDSQKVDFIVKNRYEKLVSNKIMNDIKNSKVENSFILSTDGKIKYYGTNNSSTHCPVPSDLARDSVVIHNHPKQFIDNSFWSYSDLAQVNQPFKPFSSADIVNNIARGSKKAYVVDSFGGKYEFIPNYANRNSQGLFFLKSDLEDITHSAFAKSKNISEAFKNMYNGFIQRIKQDGHSFKFLNLFEN